MGRKQSKAKSVAGRNKLGWKANSPDGKFLAKLLQKKQVSAGITPGAIKELHPRFYKYKNDSFAAGLRRMKTKYGCNVRGGTGKSIDRLGFMFGFAPSNTLLLSSIDDEDEDDDDEAVTLGSEDDDDDEEEDGPLEEDEASVAGHFIQVPPAFSRVSSSLASASSSSVPGEWKPPFIKGRYQDSSMAWHQVVLVLLPTGVADMSTQDLDIGLEQTVSGTVLSIGMFWPQWISEHSFLLFIEKEMQRDMDKQIKVLPANKRQQAKYNFRSDFALMSQEVRKQMTLMRQDPQRPAIKCTAKIKLDLVVKSITEDDWMFAGNSDGVRLLFVNLKAPPVTSYEEKQVKNLRLAMDVDSESE